MIFAGFPTTTEYSGIYPETIVLLPIIEPLPIKVPGKTTESNPIQTLSSIVIGEEVEKGI
jgi:hypothetical protein